jgi:predicted dehydrogenase
LGVVGLGYWGPNLLRVLSGLESVDIKWIADLDVDRVGRMQRRYPAARGTTRFDDILEDESVDAVVIATSVLTHFDLALRSLQAGKHTFVEKPLATSSDMADRLVAEAAERRLLLTCGHTFLYSPAVRAVKDLLVARALGDLFFVSSSRVNLGLHQRDVSVVWDLGPHDFSILLYWLEELPTSVRAVGRDSVVKGIPDVAFVTLVFASGLVANIELSWLAPSKLRRTVLVGNEGMVVYEDGAPEPIKVFDHEVVYEDPETFGEYHLSYRTGDIHTPRIETFEPLALELRDFVRAMETGSRMPGHMLLTKRIVRLTEAAEESLRSGGDAVALHPSDRFESLDSELPACVPGPRD